MIILYESVNTIATISAPWVTASPKATHETPKKATCHCQTLFLKARRLSAVTVTLMFPNTIMSRKVVSWYETLIRLSTPLWRMFYNHQSMFLLAESVYVPSAFFGFSKNEVIISFLVEHNWSISLISLNGFTTCVLL